MQLLPVAHAVVIFMFGPRKPNSSETRPEAESIRILGIASGLTPRCPFVAISMTVSAND
jgi:hypothetical protein